MKIKKTFIIFFVFVLVGWISNIVAFLLPYEPIHQNIMKSKDIFLLEGAFPPVIGENYKNSLADNNTDAWMLLMADYDGEKSVLEKSLGGFYKTYKNSLNSGMWGLDNFISSSDDENLVTGEASYSRYWHGWILPLRILLLFFSYENIRYVGMNCILLLMLLNYYCLIKRGLKYYAVAFFAANTFVLPITAMISFEYAFCYYIMLISNIVLLKYFDKISNTIGIPLYFMSIGISCAYFDFLTYPLVTLGFCLITCIFLQVEQDFTRQLLQIIKNSVLWGIGYLGMWFLKWCLGTLVLGSGVFSEAISQLILRTSTTDGLGSLTDTTISYIDVLQNNLVVFMTRGYGFSFLVFTIFFVVALLRHRIQIKHRIFECAFIYLIIGCMPFVWAFLLKNHTFLHRNFTSNIFAITVLAFFSFFAYVLNDKFEDRRKQSEY